MKLKISLIILALSYSGQAISDNYIGVLKKSPTNHFQLLLNNLNMLFMAKFEGNESENANPTEPQQKFLKFYESESGNLVADGFYQAPVSMVTRSKCNEIANKAHTDLKGDGSKLSALLRMVSYYDMSLENSMDIVNDSHVNVTIQAIENKELSVSCTK